MQDVITINNYSEFEQKFDNVMQETAERFVVIGYLLKVARDTDILRESGYSTMGEFAQKRYGLTKDIASRYIAINDRYSEGGYSEQLAPKYKSFGYAKLAEMLTLPDAIAEEIRPEMTKTEIRAIKEEIREEQAVSDIEVMLEEKDAAVEVLDTLLGKVLYQIGREHPELFKNLWVAVNENTPDMEYLLNALAPSGMAMISCRISGMGRFMLSVEEEEIKIINVRSGEKEEYAWEDFRRVAVQLLQTEEDWKIAYWGIYGEEIPEEKPEVAPVQPKSDRVVKSVKPKQLEKPREVSKKEPEKVEPEEQISGQMEMADYPGVMPEKEEKENVENNIRNPVSFPESGEAADKGRGTIDDESEIIIARLKVVMHSEPMRIYKGMPKDLNIAVAALEKQIPKKPNYEGDGYADGKLVYDTWICPNCERHYEVDCEEYDYCPRCGQKIDWSNRSE